MLPYLCELEFEVMLAELRKVDKCGLGLRLYVGRHELYEQQNVSHPSIASCKLVVWHISRRPDGRRWRWQTRGGARASRSVRLSGRSVRRVCGNIADIIAASCFASVTVMVIPSRSLHTVGSRARA